MTGISGDIEVKCPHCGEKILKSDGDIYVLRNRATLFKAHNTVSLCKRCGREVSVPVRIIA